VKGDAEEEEESEEEMEGEKATPRLRMGRITLINLDRILDIQ
jgi:hypothetical protein